MVLSCACLAPSLSPSLAAVCTTFSVFCYDLIWAEELNPSPRQRRADSLLVKPKTRIQKSGLPLSSFISSKRVDKFCFSLGSGVYITLKYKTLGSGALPSLMLDLGILKIIWGEFFPISSPSGGL